ncbi:MAG TPA: tetratricopeptide repeat protein [Pirellulaceae bacterium]|jgi:TolA-binding protein|nr:tetratricopeptide repeat protein [Pirellulaceae bacterium]
MDGLGRYAAWSCVVVACGVALPLCAQTADERFDVASSHYSRGWYDRAAESFGQFADAFPDDPRVADARFFQGEAALATDSLEIARSAFKAVVQARPTEDRLGHAEFRLAEIAFRQERYQEAAEAYAAFVEARPQHALVSNAAMQAGHAHWKRGAFDEAEAAYRDGLTRATDQNVIQEFRLALARTYAALNRHADAVRFYETVLSALPADAASAALRLELAECRFAVRDFATAADEFEAAFEASDDPAAKATIAERRIEALYRSEKWESLCGFAASESGWAALAKSPAALQRQADALGRLNKFAEASDVRNRLLEGEFPASFRANALRRLALAAFEADEPKKALTLCESHAELLPRADGDAVVRSRLARAHLANDEYPKAEALLRECLALEGLPEETRAYLFYDLGVACAKQDQPQRALEAFRQAPRDAPKELAQVIALAAADAATYAGDWKLAEEYLRRYESLLDASEAPEAVRRRLFVAVANQGSDDAEAARLLRSLKRNDEADAFFWTALDRFLLRVQATAPTLFAEFDGLRHGAAAPDTVRARAQIEAGFAALASGDVAGAKETLEAALQLTPEGAIARDAAWGLLEAAVQETDLAAVDAQIQRLRDLKADDSRLRQASLLRSRALSAKGDLAGSVAELKRLVAALDALDEPSKADERKTLLPLALFDLAGRLTEAGNDVDATAAYERIVGEFSVSPVGADALYRLAESAYRAERTEECEKLLTDLLAGKPRAELAVHAWYLRGQNAAQDEAWDRVVTSMEALLAEAPDSPLRFEAEYWIAEAKFRQKDFASAGARFDELAAKLGENEPAWKGMIPLRRAQILAAGSRFAEALALLALFDESFPDFRQRHEVDYLCGRSLARLGRFEEARAEFDAAIRAPSGSAGEIAAMAQWMIGETYFHQERFEEAIAAYDLVEAKYDFPKWQATALLQAGKCYERLNKTDEAARNYAYLIKNYGQTPLAEEAGKRLRTTSNRPRQALRHAELK